MAYSISISVAAIFRGIKLTLHGSDISALDVVLEFGDLLLEFIEGDKLILNDEGDLEFLDPVADGDKLGATPNETFLFDRTNALLERLQVGFIVPRLNLKCHNRLHIIISMQQHQRGLNTTYFSDGLGFVGLFGVICSNTFGFELLGFSIILLIGSEEIDIVVTGLLFLLGGSRGSLTGENSTGTTRTGEGGELSLVGFDVLVPAGYIGVSQILGKSLEDGNIGLRWGVPDKQGRGSSQF